MRQQQEMIKIKDLCVQISTFSGGDTVGGLPNQPGQRVCMEQQCQGGAPPLFRGGYWPSLAVAVGSPVLPQRTCVARPARTTPAGVIQRVVSQSSPMKGHSWIDGMKEVPPLCRGSNRWCHDCWSNFKFVCVLKMSRN